MFLDHCMYALDVLQETGLLPSKHADSPTPQNHKLAMLLVHSMQIQLSIGTSWSALFIS